jgi:hypothetical protein
MMNSALPKAIIAERQAAARRAGERARAISVARAAEREARATARDERASRPRPRAVVAWGMRALRRAPAA